MQEATAKVSRGCDQLREAVSSFVDASGEALRGGKNLLNGTVHTVHGFHRLARGVQTAVRVSAPYLRLDRYEVAGRQAREAINLGRDSVSTLAQNADTVTGASSAAASQSYVGMAARLGWAAATSPLNAAVSTPSTVRASAGLVRAGTQLGSAAVTVAEATIPVVRAATNDPAVQQAIEMGGSEFGVGSSELAVGGYQLFSAGTSAMGAAGTAARGLCDIVSGALQIVSIKLGEGQAPEEVDTSGWTPEELQQYQEQRQFQSTYAVPGAFPLLAPAAGGD